MAKGSAGVSSGLGRLHVAWLWAEGPACAMCLIWIQHTSTTWVLSGGKTPDKAQHLLFPAASPKDPGKAAVAVCVRVCVCVTRSPRGAVPDRTLAERTRAVRVLHPAFSLNAMAWRIHGGSVGLHFILFD